MKIKLRAYADKDIQSLVEIWNEVVEDGIAFPQEESLNLAQGREFFAAQAYTGVAEDAETGKILGLYILHPNNVGRCGHIANASYAVSGASRGLHVGEKLVQDCLEQGRSHGFRVLQFNAVVATNVHARHLYAEAGI
jgi:L-amino acid N-acyltransferase YncA